MRFRLLLISMLAGAPLAAQSPPRPSPLSRLWASADPDSTDLNALTRATAAEGDRATLASLALLLRDHERPRIVRRYAVAAIGLYLDPRGASAIVEGLEEGRFPDRPFEAPLDHPLFVPSDALTPGLRDSIIAFLIEVATFPGEDSVVRRSAAALAFHDLSGERWSFIDRSTCRARAAALADSLADLRSFRDCPKTFRGVLAALWQRPTTGESLESILFLSQEVRDDSLMRVYAKAALRTDLPRAMRLAALHAIATQAAPSLFARTTTYFLQERKEAWRCDGWANGFRDHAVPVDGPESVATRGETSPSARLAQISRRSGDRLVANAAAFLARCAAGPTELSTTPLMLGAPPSWSDLPPYRALIRGMGIEGHIGEAFPIELGETNIPQNSYFSEFWWTLHPPRPTILPVTGRPLPQAALVVLMKSDSARAYVVPLGAGQAERPFGTYSSLEPAAMLPVPPLDVPTGFEIQVGAPLSLTHRYEFPPAMATLLVQEGRAEGRLVGSGRMVFVSGERPICEIFIAVGTDGQNWEAAVVGRWSNGVGRALLHRIRTRDPKLWIYRVAWPTRACGSAMAGGTLPDDDH